MHLGTRGVVSFASAEAPDVDMGRSGTERTNKMMTDSDEAMDVTLTDSDEAMNVTDKDATEEASVSEVPTDGKDKDACEETSVAQNMNWLKIRDKAVVVDSTLDDLQSKISCSDPGKLAVKANDA